MKCALVVLCAFTFASLAEAKWCIQKTRTHVENRKVLTKSVIIPATWVTSASEKIITYSIIERTPRIKEARVCCEGYVLDDLTRNCIPVCADGCPNLAECMEPNTCKCHQGYSLIEGTCRLGCANCENGRCTDLGACQCNTMYVRVDNTCKPLCSRKCANGFCAAPDVCKCNPGYLMSAVTNRCEPICKQSCGVNAYCVSPDVCSCNHRFFGNASDICQPWCKSECKNGQCLGPNNCACYQGFVKVDGLCIPDCQSGCKFGDCLDEGVCQCWPDFVYNNSTGSCQESLEMAPTTEVIASCVNDCMFTSESSTSDPFTSESSTSDPFTSESFTSESSTSDPFTSESFTSESSTSNPFTSESFTSESSTSDPFTSEPSTIEEARNSTDICWGGTRINGVCQCPEGLVLNKHNDCIMPCEAICKNGICTQDDVCQCLTGYVHDNGKECIPHCDRECVNSFCIYPNRCECLEGYTPNVDPSFAHVCQPTCNSLEGCLNGTCVAVNKCQCLDGFTPDPGNRFRCVLKVRGYWYIYLLLGLLVLFLMGVLCLLTMRKMHQDSYDVENVEKHRGTVRYMNSDQPYCVI